MRVWHLADQVMCPQQWKLTRDRSGLAVRLDFEAGALLNSKAEITIAEAVERELAAAYHLSSAASAGACGLSARTRRPLCRVGRQSRAASSPSEVVSSPRPAPEGSVRWPPARLPPGDAGQQSPCACAASSAAHSACPQEHGSLEVRPRR